MSDFCAYAYVRSLRRRMYHDRDRLRRITRAKYFIWAVYSNVEEVI